MKLNSIVVAATLLLAAPALAGETVIPPAPPVAPTPTDTTRPTPRAVQQARQPLPDPATPITLTFGELTLLMQMRDAQTAAKVAEQAASSALAKLQAQATAHGAQPAQ